MLNIEPPETARPVASIDHTPSTLNLGLLHEVVLWAQISAGSSQPVWCVTVSVFLSALKLKYFSTGLPLTVHAWYEMQSAVIC